MTLLKNNKGDLPDILIFLITVFILAIGLFILAFVVPQISGGLNSAGLNSSTEGTNAITRLGEFGTITIQRGFFLLFAGLIMGTLISSFFIRTHPIFIFLYIIFMGLTVFIGTYLGNAYETISNIEIFSDTLASQGLINIVMNNIVKIIIGVGALSLIIIFSKFTSGSGGGGAQRI